MWFIRTRRRDPEAVLFVLIDSRPQKFKNLSIQTGTLNDSKTHTVVIAIPKKILIPIDKDVASRHGINDGDPVSLVEEETGIIKLIFKGTKIRVGRTLPSNQSTIERGYPT
jgi:hypothetical protein